MFLYYVSFRVESVYRLVDSETFNGRHRRQKHCVFMHLSSFLFFIKCFFRLVERTKDTVKCFFYSSLSMCVNRFQLQYIFLKAEYFLIR